jgi:hypothetical protein
VFPHYECSHQQRQSNTQICYEAQEVPVIIQTDAVVCPNAMVVHVNDIPFAGRAMVAAMRFQRLKNTFEALVLIFSKISLAAIEESHKTFVPFANERLQVRRHPLRILLFKVEHEMSSSCCDSLRVAWVSDPSFNVGVDQTDK